MIKQVVHLFVLPLRALVMVVATLPTGYACGGPVIGEACPMPPSAHHRVLDGWLPGRSVSWKVSRDHITAHAESSLGITSGGL
jgi:hypothetical protein